MKGTTYRAVLREIDKARDQHGNSVERAIEAGNHDRVLRILVEEVGEVADAIEHLENVDARYLPDCVGDLRAELVQVAATAVRWIEALDVRDGVGQHVREAGK